MNTNRLELQVKRHDAAASPRFRNKMKCPVCPETDLVMTERQCVEIDYCPKCRGVWLDRGELTLEEANQVNAHVVERLRVHGVQIGAVYCCPHQRADNCVCIKPKPYFLEQAARDHGLDLRRSFVIGDHPHDVELARNVGATGIHVLTGHELKHLAELRGDEVVASDIAAAADWILSRITGIAPHVPAERHQAMGAST